MKAIGTKSGKRNLKDEQPAQESTQAQLPESPKVGPNANSDLPSIRNPFAGNDNVGGEKVNLVEDSQGVSVQPDIPTKKIVSTKDLINQGGIGTIPAIEIPDSSVPNKVDMEEETQGLPQKEEEQLPESPLMTEDEKSKLGIETCEMLQSWFETWYQKSAQKNWIVNV